MLTRIAPYVTRFQGYADRPWYLPALSLIVALDLFILVIPSDGLLVSSVLMNRTRWLRMGIWVSVGSSLGALVLAALIQWDADFITQALFPNLFNSKAWAQADSFITDYGVWALAFVSFSIFPQQPAVVVAALSGMSLPTIFMAVLMGRLLKYIPLSAAAAYAPHYLGKIWFVRKELEELNEGASKSTAPRKGTSHSPIL